MNPQAAASQSNFKKTLSGIVPYIFLLGAVTGAIGCLGRADYNLPVFLFAYIAWSYLPVLSVNLVSQMEDHHRFDLFIPRRRLLVHHLLHYHQRRFV